VQLICSENIQARYFERLLKMPRMSVASIVCEFLATLCLGPKCFEMVEVGLPTENDLCLG
jgi:hypothetical protein